MLVIIGSNDRYLGGTLSEMVKTEALRSIRTADVERLLRDMKKPERMAIIDMTWEAVQAPGVLRQIVNISRITGNQVICICPDQEEDLKKIARNARADEVFIRYDLLGPFKEFLKTAYVSAKKE